MTNLVKLVRIDDKRSQTVARKFMQCWLTRYPWRKRCVHNPATESTGPEFQTLLQNCHIRDMCTTAKNPQSNAVCERMIHNRKYMGTHCQIHGAHCQIYGDILPTQNICTMYMGTDCLYKRIYMEYH